MPIRIIIEEGRTTGTPLLVYTIIKSSSSPRAFPIIWGRRNAIAFDTSTLSYPVHPPPLTTRLVFCLPLRLFPGTGESNIVLSTCLRPFSYHVRTTLAFSPCFSLPLVLLLLIVSHVRF